MTTRWQMMAIKTVTITVTRRWLISFKMSRLAKCFLVVLLIFWTISPIAGKLSEHLNFVLPSQRNTTLQVNVTGGTIQGAESVTYHKNVTFFKYLGIPYAEPPIDDLRWKVSICKYLSAYKMIFFGFLGFLVSPTSTSMARCPQCNSGASILCPNVHRWRNRRLPLHERLRPTNCTQPESPVLVLTINVSEKPDKLRGDGVDLRRAFRERQRQLLTLRAGFFAGAASRLRQLQLSPGHIRLPQQRGHDAARKLRPQGSSARAALDTGEHRQVRRRSPTCDYLRRQLGRCMRQLFAADSASEGAIPARHHAKRQRPLSVGIPTWTA